MESSLNHDTSWTAATNWTIAGGSLVDSLAFESSLSPITDEDNNDQDQFSTVDSKSKSPVILYAPTSDPAPCEITINFAQKHEVRQVYVRSTARVYEIYCAPEQQSSTEYLCTVRCGIAARDEEVLLATNVEAVLAHARSSIQEPAEEKLRNGSSLSPNEDDWVEVKALDSPLAINRNSSSSNSDIKPERNSQNLQVFYEATAEITDANPSTSLTLRLLSLQNKGYVCVDEVYVFGDPADASNSDNQVGPMENSAGNSLMAMLVPAFFQMSKSKGIGGGEDKYNIDTRERQNSQDNGSKAAAPADAEKKIQVQERLQEAAGPTLKSVQHEISQQVSNTESKPNISHNHYEGVLDVLVSRVNRIEDLLLRFEESMMKPINSIDVRLQRVEQQLDALAKKTENPALVCCTGISAPDFSCSEPETNSSYNSISRDISYAACEANRSNSPSSLTSVLPDVASVSVNDIKIQPGLVVTAPEFSNYDDEEEDHAVESVKESPKDKQKHTMSIDDALAYALAGFLSSTSSQSQKYSPTLAVNTPDFSSIEENIDEHMTPPIAESERNMDPPTCFCEPDGTEHLGNPVSSVSNINFFRGRKECDEIS
ncbi:40S RIBOSOMAL PROTEIN S27 [Salix koriyanagi]|uniref:40S RIBOSOMAL PROTEIN S27 n=1 Tax=Salix koriyanagi TaxID=2511006 RepID=A0A9Q0X215_9ROSI|nr:40S RIBOSOMAL PROTEIN S27 [Salix koriyanagi]